MTRIHRGIAALAAALLLAAEPGGCQPQDPQPPAEQPPPAAGGNPAPPPEDPPLQDAAQETAVFQVRAWNEHGDPIRRGIAITVTALQADGQPAKAFDDRTGEQHPNPIWLMRQTPYEYRMGMGRGVGAGSMTIAVILAPRETIACWVEVGGQEVDGTYEQKTLESPLDAASRVEGSVSLSCLYAIGAG